MAIQELIEIFNATRKSQNICLTPNQIEDLIKDLEEKELLETELKLEKDKVKYVMKQLKKQDKILDILKEYLTPHILEELCVEEKEVWEWLGNE